MIEEYIVYADDSEVLVQVLHKKIIAAGPLLRPFIGKKLRQLDEKVKEERWLMRLIPQLQLTPKQLEPTSSTVADPS